MTFSFENNLPAHVAASPLLISGTESMELPCKKYLLVTSDTGTVSAFEIHYAYHCSPFSSALLIEGVLAAGFEDCFYLYDCNANKNLLRLKMEGYFSHIYSDNGLLYVADASGLYCVSLSGQISWQQNNLGIDGVTIHTFTDDKIFGAGEWDPPGGWRDFVLNKTTGAMIQ